LIRYHNRSIVVGYTLFLYLSILLTPFLPPVALVLVGVMTLIHNDKWSLKSFPEGIFFGFMILSIISWYFNPSWFDNGIPIGIVPVMTFGFYYLLTVWMRNIVNWNWVEIQRLYLFFWLGGIYVAIIVIVQQVDWPVLSNSTLGHLLEFYREYQWQSENSVRSVGTAGNSNLAAAMLICFSLMSIYALTIFRETWQKGAALLLFVLFCTAIWCTGSRGAWVGLIIGLIVQVWMTGHRRRTLILGISLLTLVMIYPEIIPRTDTLVSTFNVRFIVWSNAFDIFQEHWLVGTLPLHFGQLFLERAGFHVFHAHNVFLGVATEFGVIGLCLFLCLIFMTIRRARDWRKTAETKEEKRLAGMLISQTIALLGHGMYDYPIISPQVGLIFMLSIIIIHIQYERRCVQRSEWSEPQDVREIPIDYKWVSSLYLLLRDFWKVKRIKE